MVYVTTPIYYVNDDPHIGHIYSTVIADVLTRFFRLNGMSSFLLTGTDDHAQKVLSAAEANNMEISDWANHKASRFFNAFSEYRVEFNQFIQTSSQSHKYQVTQFVDDLLKSGDIYPSEYEGWYDQGQEEYVSEAKAKESNYCSPINKKPLVKKKEFCLFFKLSSYAYQVENLIINDTIKIRPESRRREILARFKEKIHDIPCSRLNTSDWGIPVPGYPDQTVYVWVDALLSYLSTVNTDENRHFWPPKFQIIGKDILWFHALIWPSLLLALSKKHKWLKLPELIISHSFWIRNGEKMSKSLGNFISLKDLKLFTDKIGIDAMRFFLIDSGPNESSDADFNAMKLQETYSSLLANTFGNCCNRVITMILKYCNEAIPNSEVKSFFPSEKVMEIVNKARNDVISGKFYALSSEGLKVVRMVNAFIHSSEPYKLIKDPSKLPEVHAVVYDSVEALRLASLLLWPVMPEKVALFWDAIGIREEMESLIKGDFSRDVFKWGRLPFGIVVKKLPLLFPQEVISKNTV